MNTDENENLVQTISWICESLLCWLYAKYLDCLPILSSLSSTAATAVTVSYQNHIRFPSGVHNNYKYEKTPTISKEKPKQLLKCKIQCKQAKTNSKPWTWTCNGSIHPGHQHAQV